MLIAIIGLGDIARKAYLPVLGARQDLDLILSSRSPDSIRQIQAQYRIAHGERDLEVVLKSRPQAAFVLTPSDTHFVIVKRLLEAGIDVFVEKPATLHSNETRELAEVADRRERVLMVGFNRRFAPLHRQARELLGDTPVSLGLFEKHRANASHPSLGHQFIDDTIHQIDMLRYFCGEGKVVSTTYQVGEGLLFGAVSTVALESGGIGVVATSLRAGAWTETYAIHGGKLSAFVEAFNRLRLVSPQGEKTWQETYASSWKTTLDGRGFSGQIDHFFECVRERKQPLTSAWDSVKTQLLVEEMVAWAAG
jgi:virulence factor